jgi:hypothetical protein
MSGASRTHFSSLSRCSEHNDSVRSTPSDISATTSNDHVNDQHTNQQNLEQQQFEFSGKPDSSQTDQKVFVQPVDACLCTPTGRGKSYFVNIGGKDYPIRAGEDTAKISLYLRWENEEIFERLHAARLAAEGDDIENSFIDLGKFIPQESESDNSFPEEKLIAALPELENEWQVLPYGSGGKSGKPYMAFHLVKTDAPDIVLVLRDSNYNASCINGILDIGSLSLMCKGSLARMWLEVKALLKSAGAEVIKHLLSRVDLAIDVSGFPVVPFVEKLRNNHYVGGGNYDTEYEGEFFRERRIPQAISCGRKQRLYACGYMTNSGRWKASAKAQSRRLYLKF